MHPLRVFVIHLFFPIGLTNIQVSQTEYDEVCLVDERPICGDLGSFHAHRVFRVTALHKVAVRRAKVLLPGYFGTLRKHSHLEQRLGVLIYKLI